MAMMNWKQLTTNKRYGLEEKYDTVKEDRTQFQRDFRPTDIFRAFSPHAKQNTSVSAPGKRVCAQQINP